MKRTIQILLIAAGTICVALGVIGIFVPILPTTPFLLLAAALYARSSARFYNWLLNNRWLGKYLQNYREGKGIAKRHKILTLVALWLTIGTTALGLDVQIWIKILLVLIAVGVTAHLVKTKTYSPDRTIFPSESSASK